MRSGSERRRRSHSKRQGSVLQFDCRKSRAVAVMALAMPRRSRLTPAQHTVSGRASVGPADWHGTARHGRAEWSRATNLRLVDYVIAHHIASDPFFFPGPRAPPATELFDEQVCN